MQNLETLRQLFLGDLADDGRERGGGERRRERENNAWFNGHFVALAHALRSDQYHYQESIVTLVTTFDASVNGFNSHSSNWPLFSYSFFEFKCTYSL